jgi:hypothetical protein
MSDTLDEVPYPEVDISFDEWGTITHHAIKGIKENLYNLASDKQREFFLLDVFENIFNELNNIFYLVSNEYLFKDDKIQEQANQIIEERRNTPDFDAEPECYVKPWDRYFLHNKSTAYINRCGLSVYTFTSEVSELCYDYGIKFEEIINKVMIWNNVSSGDIRPFFHYKVSSGGYMVMGDYEPTNQPTTEVSAKVIQLSKRSSAIEFSDIFHSKYKDDYMAFFDELKKEQFGFITSDDKWKTKARAYQFYKLLQKGEIKVIRETLPDGRIINDTIVKDLFHNVFGIEPENFRARTALTKDNEDKFNSAIRSVANRIKG